MNSFSDKMNKYLKVTGEDAIFIGQLLQNFIRYNINYYDYLNAEEEQGSILKK